MTRDFNEPHVGIVVEGAGDLHAVPVILRRFMHSIGDYRDILGKPVPAHGRDKALRAKGIEGFVATAAARPGCVGVLVVLDGEGDCVAELGPMLLDRARSVTGKPVLVVLADRDFESWLFASAETLDLDIAYDGARQGQSAISEAIRPAKYVKPTWQPRLAAKVDVGLAASRQRSFARAIERFDALRALIP